MDEDEEEDDNDDGAGAAGPAVVPLAPTPRRPMPPAVAGVAFGEPSTTAANPLGAGGASSGRVPSTEAVQVFLRLRPAMAAEIAAGALAPVEVVDFTTVRLQPAPAARGFGVLARMLQSPKTYQFSGVFPDYITQEQVFRLTALQLVHDCFHGKVRHCLPALRVCLKPCGSRTHTDTHLWRRQWRLMQRACR